MPKIIKDGVTYGGLPSISYDCEVSDITLYATNWDSTTNIYTISDSRIDGTSVQEFSPAVGITDTQLKALQAANIADGGQDSGHAYLKAYGTIPEIDIPIRIMFNPGVKTKVVGNEVAEFTISSANWSSETTTVDGTAYYTYEISLTAASLDTPIISISAIGTLPTSAEQAAYDTWQYATVDKLNLVLKLYSESVPESDFKISVWGVK